MRSLFLFQLVAFFPQRYSSGDFFPFHQMEFLFRPGCFPVPFMLLHLSYFLLLFTVTYLVTRERSIFKIPAISPKVNLKSFKYCNKLCNRMRFYGFFFIGFLVILPQFMSFTHYLSLIGYLLIISFF
ncbi:MAG: hypothetical protein Ct9H90mP7_2110 [Candidatus Neomarinimicrobiota bacterium]|nr:MAG: hypothetical protein Ct9H90mP7_2110 [Candidatus Neomarinimicrobiota bacterium]